MRRRRPRRAALLAGAVLAAAVLARPAAAGIVEKSGTFGGLKLSYEVLLPPHYDPARAYPVVLVFAGGPQLLRMARSTIETDWQTEAEKRGYIVVSPGTPDGSLFFQNADRVFPGFLDAIMKDYKVAGGKLHIAGHSNGGISAFHVAVHYPRYFSTVTGYPGLLNDSADGERVGALRRMCLFMHVGDQDRGWMPAMREQAKSLERAGYRVKITVEKGQGHRLHAREIGLSPRLFDEIESCK